MPYKLLFVDDEFNVLKGLARMLKTFRHGWEVHFAYSTDEALGMLQSMDVDTVVSDIAMPGKDGFELLSAVRRSEQTRDIPVLMLTGLDGESLKRKALDLGATDLLSKPVRHEDLTARINNMLRIKAYQDEIKTQKALLDQKVAERTEELQAARLDLIWRLGRAAEFRDTDTGNHVVRVGWYCKVMAENLGMTRDFSEMIFLTAPLHDLGKIGIPDSILLKPGKLNDEEWRMMKQHCRIGADILGRNSAKWMPFLKQPGRAGKPKRTDHHNPFLKSAQTIALTHHERWDGLGYPSGLKGESIPIESRIIAVADVCDALYSKRPYKSEFSEEKVTAIIKESKGNRFDPQVVDCFEKSHYLIKEIRREYKD